MTSMPALLPRPTSVTPGEGSLTLDGDLAIDAPPAWAGVARRLLGPGTGWELPQRAGGALRIVKDAALAEEAYRLAVGEDGIEIAAATERGVNWAVQTLRQLMPAAVLRPAPSGQAMTLPLVTIEDAPRFAWRGVMLDVARHFMPLTDLYGFVDLLAAHKLNVLHLHLSEDQGWRLESHRHPRLQEIGSHRAQTRRPREDDGDGTPHGGFYTQEQLRSVVSYAEQRGIAVVPELDFPGHVRSVLAAYPELGNDPTAQHTTAETFGIFDEVLNLSEETMAFVFDLFSELLEIFPSPYIHAGGDECPRTEWTGSVAAKELAQERGLDSPEELQNWFTRHVRDWLAERGRTLVGWDEINAEGHLQGAVTMAWRGPQYGVEAARAGGQVIMAPCSHLYFDYYNSADEAEPYAIGGHLPIETVYDFDPVESMTPQEAQRVLGTQAQLWTEYMPTMRRVQYHLFPRGCAHAEVAWSDPAGRSWAEFEPRLSDHLQRLDALGVNYRPLAGPLPWQQGGTGSMRRPDHHRTTHDPEA